MVHDPIGRVGKSTFAMMMKCLDNAILVPQFCDTSDKLMQHVCSSTGDRRKDLIYILDLPRALDKHAWRRWCGVVEVIKGGYMYDSRYKSKDWVIDTPGVLVFTNHLPPRSAYTADRWDIRRVEAIEELDVLPMFEDAEVVEEQVEGQDDEVDLLCHEVLSSD